MGNSYKINRPKNEEKFLFFFSWKSIFFYQTNHQTMQRIQKMFLSLLAILKVLLDFKNQFRRD